jgi:hypothetical protein
MFVRNKLVLTCTMLSLLLAGATARAGWGVGVSVHVPIYPFGCCYPYRCYRPYPVVVAPAVVVAGPTVVQPVEVVQPVYPAPVQAVPAQAASTQAAPASTALTPVPNNSVRTVASSDSRSRDIDHYLQTLNSNDEKQRIEAMMQLGRLRADQSADVLSGILSNDRSPAVREAAARALGLLGSPRALAALQRSAQSDDDATVRNSASYAADVIRSRMPR